MAITHVWTGSDIGDPPQLAPHLADDLIIMVAIRLTSSAAPGLASGWTNILTHTTGGHGMRIAYRVATADAPGGASSGSWSNADVFFGTIYRGADPDDPIGAATANAGTGTTVTHPGLTLEGDSPSMIHVGAMRRNSWTAPSLGTGATNLDQMQVTSGGVQSGFRVGRSSSEVSSWTARTVSISPSDPWKTFAVEILSGSIDLSTSGGLSFGLGTSGTDTKSVAAASPLSPAWIDSGMNGSFETDLSGWQSSFFGEVYAEITRDTTKYRSGVASLRAEARQDMDGDTVFDRARVFHYRVFAYPGARYRATGWVWFDTSVTSWYTGSFLDGSMPMTYGTTTGEWVQVQSEGIALADQFVFEVVADGINPVFWVDDVTVEWYSDALGVWLDVDGEVVKAEGEIKPTASGINLQIPTLVGDGVKHGISEPGFPLDLALSGEPFKAGAVNGLLPLILPISGDDTKAVTRDGSIGLHLNIGGQTSREEENLTGLLTRIVAYEPNGSRLGILPAWQDWTVTVPYGSDNGAFDGTYPLIGPRGDVLNDPVELALEVFNGSEYVEPNDCRWLVLNSSGDEIDPTATNSVTGVSMGFHLSKTYVADGPTDGQTTGERRFTSATAGRIMSTLCTEAKARGALTGVDVSTFDSNTDSAGQPWSLVKSLGFTVGVSMSSVVESLIQQGMIEIRWNARQMLLYDAETSSRDRTLEAHPVVLSSGRDITSAPVQRTMVDVATNALVRGDEGLAIEITNSEATSPWGRWETTLDQSGVTDLDDLAEAGESLVKTTSIGREQHTHGLNFVGARFMPFISYRPGDWVYSITNGSASRERYRLRQITLEFKDGVVGGSAILNDILVEQDVKILKRINGVQGGASNAGPRPRPTEGDNTTPNAPTSLSGYSSIYLEDGAHRAEVVLSWTDPTKNTDGSDLTDLNVVQIWARPNVSGVTWRLLSAVEEGAESLRFGPLPTSQTYQFRLTAIDYTGHTSAYSNTITINLGSDVTAPPRPAAPETSARNGVVEVSHNGKTNMGGDMPADFSHFEVYARNTSAVTASTTYRVGTIAKGASSVTLTDWAYNQSIYAAVVAVDVSGNKSQLSPVSAAAYNDRVDSGDIADNAVGAGELNVPAIDSAGNLNVNQLTGKTITGVTINGGIFRSTNTSQRVEMGNTGPNDSVDEIRMFNGGRVSSIRNPSDRTGWTRLSTNSSAGDQIFDFGRIDDGNGNAVIHVPGRAYLKFLASSSQVQVRNSSDSGYQPVVASAFTVASERKFKKNIKDAGLDALAALRATRARRWKWRWKEASTEPEIGLIADELPDVVRQGDGYSVTAVVALLWDALREAHERIDRLENP